MHKLRRVAGVPSNYLADIIGGKTGPRGVRLTAMVVGLNARYAVLQAAYTPAGINGVATQAWTQVEKDDLLHCYESTAKALEELKTLITERQADGIRDFCPYCGIGAPRQFDHYLPKVEFPEFSVHSYNLVPCCGSCNGLKGETWLQSNGARVLINFYIDSLPTAPMLEPDVQWSVKKGKRVPVVSFDLVRPASFSAAKFALIESHFEKLELLARYKDQAHTEFLALHDAALAREAKTVVVLRKFLKNYLEQREKTLGPLNWRIALYRELIMHTPFLQDCLKP
ncbi:HNH endonuclease [Variovorax paradoxus]|uniref:HNH endonuclease n=1 Tax=Variovorax paradoxus TaxID=34073 RepID=UPI003D65953B